jgi:uncharacterized membrane protein
VRSWHDVRWLSHRLLTGLWTAAGRLWLLTGLLLIAGAVWLAAPALPRYGVSGNPALLASLLGTVSATLGAVVGIAVAVMLVALEILRTTYASNALQEVFRSNELRHVLTLYLFTIALSVLVLSTVGSPVSQRTVALTYLVGVLFIGCLSVLYPFAKRALASSRATKRRITALGASLDVSTVREVTHIARYPPWPTLEDKA